MDENIKFYNLLKQNISNVYDKLSDYDKRIEYIKFQFYKENINSLNVFYNLMVQIIKHNGIIFGGFVRDIQYYMQKIEKNYYYDPLLDYNNDNPLQERKLRDIDIIFTNKSFIEFLGAFNRYLTLEEHNDNYKELIIKTSHTLTHKKYKYKNNNYHINLDILIIDDNENYSPTKFYLPVDFDVNSLYLSPCQCTGVSYLECPDLHKHVGNPSNKILLNSFYKINIEDIRNNIKNKRATLLNIKSYNDDNNIVSYRKNKITTRNYKIIIPEYIQELNILYPNFYVLNLNYNGNNDEGVHL